MIEKIDTVNCTKQTYEKLYESDVFKEMKNKDENAQQYAYVPFDTVEDKKTIMFEQTIEKEPNMMEVIKAFNSAS